MKRKETTNSTVGSSKQPAKKRRTSGATKTKGKGKVQDIVWSEYFQDDPITTVVLKTIPFIRDSMFVVTGLQGPSSPTSSNFAYIPRNEMRVHAETLSQVQRPSGRTSPDFSIPTQGPASSSQLPGIEEDEHVLILEFAENSKGKKDQSGLGLSLPPAMSPAQTKKLIESRDERFTRAVNELLSATPAGEDPVELLQAAARDHIPAAVKATIPSPEERNSIDDVVLEIQEQEWYKNQIVDRRTFAAREAREGTLDESLSESIQQALRDARKISSLYLHQAAAINAIWRKKHVIISTSTASGKSVIYQVPLLRLLEEDPTATAIFVYPTKALAQDQKSALEQLLWSCPGLQHIKVATYDGDTSQECRTDIRETASVIFTNFDMIHASILPHEELWRSFLKKLKLLAVDELHYYADLFGSHVAQVIRRFRRVCAAVGNKRTIFVSCSATIAKPAQHMKRLFGIEEVEEITEDGAPSGIKDYLVWDPPCVDDQAPKLGRHSSILEATRLMRFLMKRGIRVILFCKIRKACELSMKTLRADLSAEGRLDVLAKVMPYRGGYSQEDRRRIEKEAFSGNLLGIVATNALELGVDIGVLDAVIMLGFPFGIANFRQQAGRAGRRTRDSLAVLVSDNLPIDQHYVKHPDDLYNKPVDELMVDLDSKFIIEAHLQCAAQEMPLSKDDHVYFGPHLAELSDKKLIKDKDGWYHTHPKFLPYPARHVSIRGAEEEKYTLVDITKAGVPKVLEEIELSRALFEVYEGAVFMHQGLTFIVKEVSHDAKMGKVVRADVNWITSPRDFTNVDAKQTWRIKAIPNSPQLTYFGRVDVVTVVFGFYKIRNKKILDTVYIDTPPWERQGFGFWLDVPKNVLSFMRAKGLRPAEAIHAASHAWMNQFALAAELRTECKAAEKEYKLAESQRKRPARLIFYDASGKSGVSAQGFDHGKHTLGDPAQSTRRRGKLSLRGRLRELAHCREGNTVSSKSGALVVLRGLLNLEINPSSVLDVVDDAAGFDTIVEADYIRPVDGVEDRVRVGHLHR
ncbi:P-loop containing nucleoside triphosphate hydrolase protein [Melanogaster broomeanus]|nr:P-loop containing nucleoside triphosphate hydrolase protein [Melanogaster broomeanus]